MTYPFSSVIHSNTYLFADDTKCLCQMSKCSLLSIVSHSPANHSNHQAKYLINGLPISPSNQQRDFGIFNILWPILVQSHKK